MRIVITLAFSIVVLMWLCLVFQVMYPKEFGKSMDKFNFIEKLVITGTVLRTLVILDRSYRLPIYILLFLTVLPAYIVISILVIMMEYFGLRGRR